MAIHYALNHWDRLERFLDDGRIEHDTNSVALDEAGALSKKTRCSLAAMKVEQIGQPSRRWSKPAKLNGVEPYAYFTDLLTRLVHGWPQCTHR